MRQIPASNGAKKCAGVTLWYCSTRAPGSVRNAAVIGDGTAKCRIVTSPCRATASPHGRTSSSSPSSIVSA